MNNDLSTPESIARLNHASQFASPYIPLLMTNGITQTYLLNDIEMDVDEYRRRYKAECIKIQEECPFKPNMRVHVTSVPAKSVEVHPLGEPTNIMSNQMLFAKYVDDIITECVNKELNK